LFALATGASGKAGNLTLIGAWPRGHGAGGGQRNPPRDRAARPAGGARSRRRSLALTPATPLRLPLAQVLFSQALARDANAQR